MGGLAWHGEPHTTEDEPEDPRNLRPVRQEQEVPTLEGLIVRSTEIARMRAKLKPLQTDFGKSYVPAGYPALFPITEAVMMAELGLIASNMPSNKPLLQQQLVRGSQAKPAEERQTRMWDSPSLYEQYGEMIETGVKIITLVTAGAMGVGIGKKAVGFGGSHGRAFQTQRIWGGGQWPLWKVGIDNARILEIAIKTGKGPLELLDEIDVAGQYGVGTAEAFGLFGWI